MPWQFLKKQEFSYIIKTNEYINNKRLRGDKVQEMKEKEIYRPANVKHTVKDSVFTDLFEDKKYLIQLYRALHPEDTKATEDELQDITINNVFVDGIYNDIGITHYLHILTTAPLAGNQG